MSRQRRRRSSRSGKTGANVPLIISIVALCLLGITFLATNVKDEDVCGSRGADTEHEGYCLTNSSDYDNLVIVAGNTRNTPAPELDFDEDKELKKILEGVFYKAESYGNPSITIISAANGEKIKDFNNVGPGYNSIASQDNLNELKLSINDTIKTSPTHAGADYLDAILKANRAFGKSGSERNLIIVTGSGYSDTGVLDFAHSDLLQRKMQGNIDIYSLARNDPRIKEGELNNTSVYWYNMGYVAKPQDQDVMKDYINITQDIYRDALQYAGAREIVLDRGTGAYGESVHSDHNVDLVHIDKLKSGDSMMVDSNVARFVDDKDDLTNADTVKNYISSFISKLEPNQKLSLTGYIDLCKDGYDLGYRRANKIKNLIVEMGVSADRIETHGEFGPPPKNYNEAYSCYDDFSIPNEEQRTVRIVVK